ncbi:MAG: helix-hairpin-helix domain-containing protein [Oscillospiraceae bacterium]|nr:helix-hairpin-helix domain-containing protein [Oscillospiraceae bacterium]
MNEKIRDPISKNALLIIGAVLMVLVTVYNIFLVPRGEILIDRASSASGEESLDTKSSEISETVAEIGVNVNTADCEELEKIPGVGRVLAENIIKYREEIGTFKDYDDLLNVPGIGDKKLENIKKYIIFSD